jgi:tRNA pseudouridine32 synthase
MAEAPTASVQIRPGLKKIPPYWYPYTTMAKQRWLNREILEVVSTEFRDRSMEYYVCQLRNLLDMVLRLGPSDTHLRAG